MIVLFYGVRSDRLTMAGTQSVRNACVVNAETDSATVPPGQKREVQDVVCGRAAAGGSGHRAVCIGHRRDVRQGSRPLTGRCDVRPAWPDKNGQALNGVASPRCGFVDVGLRVEHVGTTGVSRDGPATMWPLVSPLWNGTGWRATTATATACPCPAAYRRKERFSGCRARDE